MFRPFFSFLNYILPSALTRFYLCTFFLHFLDIFAKRAISNEGKLQVELVMLKYYLPRLSGISGTSGRFGSGGVGMRGPGETKLELDKRKIRLQIQKLEEQIEKIKKEL